MKNHNIDVFFDVFLVRLPVAIKVSPLAGLNGLFLLMSYQGAAPIGAQRIDFRCLRSLPA